MTPYSATYAATLIALTALLILSGHPLLIATASAAVAIVIACDCARRKSVRDFAFVCLFALLALCLTAFTTIPMLLHASETWSYKLASSHGSPYRVFDSTGFWEALTWLVSYHRDEADKFDGGTMAYLLGGGAVILAIVGVAAVRRRRELAFVIALIVVGVLFAIPAPFMAAFEGISPIRYFKPWYLMFVFAFGATIALAAGFDALLDRARGAWKTVVAVVCFAVVLLPLNQPVRDVLHPLPMRDAKSEAIAFLQADRDEFRVTGYRGQTHLPNASAVTGIEDLRFSSPLIPIRYRAWFELADPEAVAKSFPTTIQNTGVPTPLLGGFNVKYILHSRGAIHFVQTFYARGAEKPLNGMFEETPLPPDYPLVRQLPSINVYLNSNHLHPRAHFASESRIVRGGMDEAAAALRALGNEVGDTEVAEVGASVTDDMVGEWKRAGAPGDRVSVRYPSQRTVEIECESASARLLVLHDSWDRGWSATIDGKAAAVMPVNLISRGIAVPAGRHVVRMGWRPRGLLAGAAVSILALAGALGVVRWASRGAR